jgi:cyclic pyranopterin phosphate synthase
MVDVSAKAPSARVAVASAELRTTPKVLRLIAEGQLPKGDALAVARIAGIQAAKRAPELIPLCHPLPVEAVTVDFEIVEPDSVRITAAVTVVAKTGVEMEALTAVSVAALTLYDMCKSADKGITIGPIRLESKTGGKSGSYRREK